MKRVQDYLRELDSVKLVDMDMTEVENGKTYILMAQVIYEALEYGFEQEELAEEFDTLSNPVSAWYKDEENYIAAVEEKALDKVPVPTDSEVNREEIEQLQQRLKAVFAVDEYRRFCYRRELKKLREMLKNEVK